MRPVVEAEVERYRAVREELAPIAAKVRSAQSFRTVRDAGFLVVPKDQEDEYREVWQSIMAERPFEPSRALTTMLNVDNFVDSLTPAAIANAHEAEHVTLRRDTAAARHPVDALKIQVEQTALALDRTRQPSGVNGGLRVLGYVTFSGVLVPLALMTLGLKSMSRLAASGVVVLFASGIVWLMLYVAHEVARLTRPPTP